MPSFSSAIASSFSIRLSKYWSLNSLYSSAVRSSGAEAMVWGSATLGCGFSLSGDRPLDMGVVVEKESLPIDGFTRNAFLVDATAMEDWLAMEALPMAAEWNPARGPTWRAMRPAVRVIAVRGILIKSG